MEKPSEGEARRARGASRAGRGLAIAALAVALIAAGLVTFGPRWVLNRTIGEARRAAGLELRWTAVDGHDIAYLDGGSGEALVLLHGFGAEKDNWTRCAQALTPRYRVVAPDLPGFGESTFVTGASYRIADQARRVVALADSLGIPRFHVAGNSMGGQIAGQLAVMYPERVRSLILVDCTGVRSPRASDMEDLIRRGDGNPLLVASVAEFDERMNYLFVRKPEIPGFIKRVLVGQARERRAQHETILAQTTPEVEALEPDLGRIQARTLIIWGGLDRMRDVSSVSVLERGIAGSSVVILPDCGHVPMSERPQETAENILHFLDHGASHGSGVPDP